MRENGRTVTIQTCEQIRSVFERTIALVGGLHVQAHDAPGMTDLLILEIGDDPENDLERLSAIQASTSAKGIFLTSVNTNPEILIRALRIGVREFFPQPIKEQDVLDALVKFKGRNGDALVAAAPAKRGKTITLLGAKGGVGTTTVAVNLAASLARLDGGPSVALLDLNPLLGEVALFLNMHPAFDWIEIVNNASRLDGTYLMSILSKHPSGFYVLPSPAKMIDGQTSIPSVIEALLRLMQQLFDFIIVDGGRCIDDISKVALKAADRLLLIGTPVLPCIVNLKKLLHTFRTLGYPPEQRVDIVANRSNQTSGISLKAVDQALGKRVLWYLPNDYRHAVAAINSGEPLNVVAEGSELSKKIAAMALALTGKSEKKGKRALFGLL
jgi:pilus assembly protein CpaE